MPKDEYEKQKHICHFEKEKSKINKLHNDITLEKATFELLRKQYESMIQEQFKK